MKTILSCVVGIQDFMFDDESRHCVKSVDTWAMLGNTLISLNESSTVRKSAKAHWSRRKFEQEMGEDRNPRTPKRRRQDRC